MKLLSLFSGIGAFEKALNNIGINVELIGFSEIDKYAIKSYCAIHNISENLNLGDITKINISTLPKNIDMITHGSPCQDFSIAGKQAGGDLGTGTRSSLMWNTINIVTFCKPKYVIWENVKNLLSKKHRHNFDSYLSIMESLGYNNYYQVLNAKDYGVPQNRERIYTVSIRKDIDTGDFLFPEKEELKLRLKDMLEKNVDDKYYLSEKLIKGFVKHNNKHKQKGTGFVWKPKNKDDVANTIRANASICPTDNTIIENNVIGVLTMDKWQDYMKRIYDINTYAPTINTMQGGNTEPKILIKNATKKGYIEATKGDSVNLSYPNSNTRRGRVGNQVSQILQCNDSMGVITNEFAIRKLTPLECWRLMGFSDDDFYRAKSTGNSNTQLYKQAGNSIVVNVLEKIFRNIKELNKQ